MDLPKIIGNGTGKIEMDWCRMDSFDRCRIVIRFSKLQQYQFGIIKVFATYLRQAFVPRVADLLSTVE